MDELYDRLVKNPEDAEKLASKFFTLFVEKFEVLKDAPRPLDREEVSNWAMGFEPTSAQAHFTRLALYLSGAELASLMQVELPPENAVGSGKRDAFVTTSPYRVGPFNWQQAIHDLSIKELRQIFDLLIQMKLNEVSEFEAASMYEAKMKEP